MEDRLGVDNRLLVRQLLQRSFASAQVATAEICSLLRESLDADLLYCGRIVDAELELVAVEERVDSGWRTGRRFPLNGTLAWRVIAAEGSFLSADLTTGPDTDVPTQAQLGMRSCAASPIRDSLGAPIGVLAAAAQRTDAFSDSDVALLEAAAGILAREHELQRVRELEAARTADLEASERRYRSLVDDLGDVVVEIDVTGRLSYVNPAGQRLTGLSLEELAGRDMMDLVHPEDRELALAHMAEVMAGEDTARPESAREARFVAADGSIRWMMVRGRALLGDDGRLSGFVGILHDVTGRVLAEQQVRQALAEAEAARDEAERASRAKSEFLSRMSHELRTPLNAILGFGQLLELAELEAEETQNVEQILRAGRHLLDLINEVLDVARVESGTLSLSLEPVDVSEVVSESLDLVRTAASGRGLTLRTPNHLDGSCVLADRQRLKQILVNLLSNAVKYNRDAGEVVVSWSPTREADAGTSEGWLRLSITDTGHGIPADRLDDVFTPFERLGAEGSDVEGTGVGLSLSRTLVQALGGRIGVRSEPGVGSTFWVDLPAAASTAQAPAEPSADVELGRRVLYVEDNPSNITLVRRILARRPHVGLEVVQDGAEAVGAAHRLLPDLVLLDLHLPGMSGESVLAAFRESEDERLRKMPIVIVTADLTAGTERRMLDAGATRFLSKPIDVRQLLDVVDEHLPQA